MSDAVLDLGHTHCKKNVVVPHSFPHEAFMLLRQYNDLNNVIQIK